MKHIIDNVIHTHRQAVKEQGAAYSATLALVKAYPEQVELDKICDAIRARMDKAQKELFKKNKSLALWAMAHGQENSKQSEAEKARKEHNKAVKAESGNNEKTETETVTQVTSLKLDEQVAQFAQELQIAVDTLDDSAREELLSGLKQAACQYMASVYATRLAKAA